MWPFIGLTGFSQRVLSGECHRTIEKGAHFQAPSNTTPSWWQMPKRQQHNSRGKFPSPLCAWFHEDEESTRLTSCLHSTPSHAMLWAGITVLQKCSSEIPSPHLATEESRVGKAYLLSFSTESKTASGPEKTVEGETSTYLQRRQSSKSTTSLPCRMGCQYLTESHEQINSWLWPKVHPVQFH